MNPAFQAGFFIKTTQTKCTKSYRGVIGDL